MAALTPYLVLPGTAREALTFYQSVFGGALTLHTFAEFGRSDGTPDAIAHGILDGPVPLFAADAGPAEPTLQVQGALFSLLGTADPATLTAWFVALSDGGTDIDALQLRPWGAHDGQVTDRYALRWLIGYED